MDYDMRQILMSWSHKVLVAVTFPSLHREQGECFRQLMFMISRYPRGFAKGE